MGYVYILSNEAMPGLLKIGMTNRNNVYLRVRELSSATGVPTPFKVEYTAKVRHAAVIEQQVHIKLNRFRVSERREFFRCSLKKAIRVIEAAEGKEARNYWILAVPFVLALMWAIFRGKI